jgi:hypothetical protein
VGDERRGGIEDERDLLGARVINAGSLDRDYI